jgi:CHAT domain-containing protein/tetratricopeptide (TPR) repeat protein
VSYRFARFVTNILSIGIIIGFSFSHSSSASWQSADEMALGSLTERFFATYQKQDLDVLMSLWSEKSPDYAASKQSFQQSFAANKIELKSTTMGKLTLDGEKASRRVLMDSRAVDVKTGKPADGFGKLNRTLHFVKEGGVWKVSRFVSSEEELAAAIAAAKTEEERKALLEADKELVTIELQRALINQGIRLRNQGSNSQAMAINQLALTIAQESGDKLGAALALRNIGSIYYSQGNYTQALEYYQKSLKASEEINDKSGIGGILSNIGSLYIMQGNYTQGMDSFLKSLKFSEEAGDKLRTANTVGNMGVIYQLQGNYLRAIEHYLRSLKLKEEVGDRAGIGASLNNLGLAHKSQGNYAQALEYFLRSLKIAEEIGDKTKISTPLMNIGSVYNLQGNNTQAMDYILKSLKIAEEIGDKAKTANSLHSIGSIHQSQGNYLQAMDYYQRSLKISEEIGDKAAHASTLNNIGLVHQSQGNFTQALEYHQRSLKAAGEIGDKNVISGNLNNLGSIYQSQGNYTQGMDYFQRSLKIKEEIGDQTGMAISLNHISSIHQAQGNYTQAVESANQATRITKQIGDLEIFWQARTTAGQAHRALKELDLARQSFTEAIAAIEDWRNQVAGAQQQQQQFFETKLSPYYEMIDLLVAQNNFQQALTFAERSKSRVLLDVLRSGKVNITKAMTGQEQEQERNLNSELASLNSQVYKEKQSEKPDQTRLADLTASLEKTRLQMEDFQTNLYAAHPELRAQRGEIHPLTSTEPASLIPDDRTALLEFVVQKDQSYLFVLTRNHKASQAATNLQVYKLNIKQKDLADLTRRFKERITSRSLGFQELASQLYSLLVKPAQAQLQSINNLVIVPDGMLWELPFQALLSAPKRFLLQDYAISYAPSLTVLKEMQSLSAKRRKGNVQANTLLALGNPAIGTETTKKVSAVFMDEKLLPLPEAERQVQALKQIYGSENSKVYIGAEASEDRLKLEAGKYQILHLATHGILNDASPMYSHLVLSQLQGKVSDDGLLEAWEIMKMDLNADLVILSACDTARGRVGAGEGMIGLAWALFVAGSPTTVVSQWKVETESNTKLMVAFHQNLKLNSNNAKEHSSKAEALQQAALKLMKNKKYSHPFYWAAFVIVGDAN